MNKTDFIAMLINTAAVLIFALGVALFMRRTLSIYLDKWRMRKRLNVRRNALKEKNHVERHLELILAVSMKKPITPSAFMAAEGIVFASVLCIGMQNISVPAAAVMASLITALPYLLLRVRLEVRRRKGSYEGERLTAEFLSQYRMSNFNIYRAIEQVIEENGDMKVSCRLLFKLLMEIRNTGSGEVIQRATDSFAFGINTNWSRMLAHNIRIAAETGMNVSLAVEDILIQLREARALAEARKRLNAEAVRMVIFLVPFMYIGTVFMATRYLGIPMGHFLENQLYTSEGFFLLTSILFLFLVNLAVMEIVNNRRFDY